MTEEIKTNLIDAKEAFEAIGKLLKDKVVGNNERQTLLVTYFDICMEHIQSIHLLINHKMYGSAFTLVRPFYETYFRALWMLKFASDPEVEGIRNNKFHFPNMGTKIKELDSIYTGTDFFERIKHNTWEAMCDYAHSGTLQLSRRWKEGELKPNYEEGEIIEVLKGTRMILLLFTYVVLKEHGYDAEAEKINTLILR